MSVTVTETAVGQLRSMMEDQKLDDHYLRIGINGMGCGGPQFFIGFDSNLTEADNKIEHEGLTVVIDSQSLPYLEGASLDYSEDPTNPGFIFNNPNAPSSGGCSSCDTGSC